jgi:DNA-directed RNA polymerase specialized sigma24 family protein
LSRDVTAWDALDLHTETGVAVPEKDRETILEVAKKALEDGYRDPKQVLQAAARVGRRAHVIENVRAYAVRAIFRVKSKMEPAQVKQEQLTDNEYGAELPDHSQVDQIENRILVRELLETLCAQDREIFLRRMAGETCPEIDSAMNLKPRTAEIRFRVCKNALRKVFQEKLDRKTCARGS